MKYKMHWKGNYGMAGKYLPDPLAFSLTFEGISLKFRNPPGSPWPNSFLPDSPGSPGSPEKWQPWTTKMAQSIQKTRMQP